MESVFRILAQVLILLVSISFHESAHAYAADRMGDPTARYLGRVTMNPLKHIDIFGTIILPAIMLLLGGFIIGYAKPVPVNPHNFRDRKKGEIVVSLAGPLSNFILALFAAVVMRLILLVMNIGTGTEMTLIRSLQPLFMLLYFLFFINVFLGVFNLIPLPPLDGSHVLKEFLSFRAREVFDRIRPFSFIIIIVLFQIGILGTVLYFFANIFSALFLGKDAYLINAILGA